MDIHQIATRLSDCLRGELPGKTAQQKMMARPRISVKLPYSPEHAIPSAVLILLFPRNDEIRFYLTQRTHVVETHKGQISLPGGAWEEGEPLTETALRETYEEIGVEEHNVTLIGGLTPLFVPVTGFMIHPFVGWVEQEPETEPDPSEVETLFSVPLNYLINDDLVNEEIRTIRGFPVDVPYFKFDRFKVWGATAMILSEFKEILKSII